MPRIAVPEGTESIHRRALSCRPDFVQPWLAMMEAVHHHSQLPLRIREGTRYRIAIANGCYMCQEYRHPDGDDAGLDDTFYAAVADLDGAGIAAFSDREISAMRYVDRFASDHRSIDDEVFITLRKHFTDDEIVDLTFCAARNVGFGRFTHVLGLDDSCELAALSSHPS